MLVRLDRDGRRGTRNEEGKMTDKERQGVQGFRDLVVWQRAMELAEEIYRVADRLPDRERFRHSRGRSSCLAPRSSSRWVSRRRPPKRRGPLRRRTGRRKIRLLGAEPEGCGVTPRNPPAGRRPGRSTPAGLLRAGIPGLDDRAAGAGAGYSCLVSFGPADGWVKPMNRTRQGSGDGGRMRRRPRIAPR